MTALSLRRCGRACALGAGVLALIVGSAVVPAAPANAVDREVTGADQEYYPYYRLASLHSQGYTGEGAIIAMIDGHVNPNIPELAGATIESRGSTPGRHQ